MINFTRRQRQAQDNTEPIVHAVWDCIKCNNTIFEKEAIIKNTCDLDNLINTIETEIIAFSSSICSDWAIPILLQIVGELYYGNYTEYQFCGNFYKRACAYLWKNSYNNPGDYKNQSRLIQFISQCYVIEILYSLKKTFIAIPNFYFSFEKGHVNIPSQFNYQFQKFGKLASGRGRRMRIADTNTQLMNSKSSAFFEALVSVLCGSEPKSIELFSKTFYENIPGIENTECEKFWKELFFRYCTYIATLSSCEDENSVTSVFLFHEFAIESYDTFFTQDIIQNSFWTHKWFNQQSQEIYANLLVHKPILRISPYGDYATSPVLIGDSINSFVEQQLLGYSNRHPYLNLPNKIFKDSFSEKFENECIDCFRKRGYLAGHILDTGIWINQNEKVTLNFDDSKIFGEVDVFAYHPKLQITFLVECKVLLDVHDSRSYNSVASKLVDDSEGFKRKLREKCKWIKHSFIKRFNIDIDSIMLLVTDIPIPVLVPYDEEIPIIDSIRLEQLLCDIENFSRN